MPTHYEMNELFTISGAFAIYLEPWHADIFEFLDLRKNQGKVLLDGIVGLNCIKTVTLPL